MGDNYGQLGDGTYNSTNQPEQIEASNVTAIAAGLGSVCFSRVMEVFGPWAGTSWPNRGW